MNRSSSIKNRAASRTRENSWKQCSLSWVLLFIGYHLRQVTQVGRPSSRSKGILALDAPLAERGRKRIGFKLEEGNVFTNDYGAVHLPL